MTAWKKNKMKSHRPSTKKSYSPTNNVANTILKQLGGNKFITMTGAKNLIDHGNALSFNLPGRGFSKYNYVKITLNENDLYNLSLSNIRKKGGIPTYTESVKLNDVYADQMVPILEEQTGLRFSL